MSEGGLAHSPLVLGEQCPAHDQDSDGHGADQPRRLRYPLVLIELLRPSSCMKIRRLLTSNAGT